MSRRWRARAPIALFLVAALGLTVLAALMRRSPPLGLDLALALWVQSWGGSELTGLFAAVSWLGYTPQNAIGTLALAAALASSGHRWRDALWLVGTQLASLVNAVLKLLIARPRPTEDAVRVYFEALDYGFPSGHVTFYASLFGFAAFLVYVHGQPGLRRRLLLALLALPIGLVGVARVHLGHHWPSDVVGGYALAAAFLVPYCALYARFRMRT